MEMLSSIIGIAMLAVAMYHAIGIFRIFLRNSKQVAAEEGHIEVQCEKCGRHYQVTLEEFNRKKMTKEKMRHNPGEGTRPGKYRQRQALVLLRKEILMSPLRN